MSVLINNMKMPKCCAECEWHEYYGGDYDWVHACRRTGTMPIENAETERANDCPLIEIPTPHGILIDADALIADLVKYQNTLDPESRENARVLSVKSYLTLARGEAIIEEED